MPRRQTAKRVFLCLAALAGLFFGSATNAQNLSPFVRIVGFAAPPIASCIVPNAEFVVIANGDANTSDTFSIFANGQQIYQWQGETMAWVAAPDPTTYSIAGEPTSLAANTILTARITTYDRANPSGPVFTAGNAVFVAQASWNCTTGEQVGAILNEDLRPKAVTAMTPAWLVAMLAGLLPIALSRTSRGRSKVA